MKIIINDGTEYDWHIEGFDTKNMEKLKDYLKQELKTSVGSRPERSKSRTDKMFLFLTKENISKEQLQGCLDKFLA